MKTSELVDRWALYQDGIRRFAFPFLLIFAIAVATAVYLTGGIKFVYSHSMYVPILLAGFIHGVRGGIIFAIIGGLALGPYMPIDTATGELQQTSNWVYRTGFFVLAGILSGFASDAARAHFRRLNWASRHDHKTGLPNRSALLEKLHVLNASNASDGIYILAVINFNNAVELKSAFGVEVIKDVIFQATERFEHLSWPHVGVFSSSSEQITGIARIDAPDEIEGFLDELVKAFQEPFLIGTVWVHADARIGYVKFDVSSNMAADPEGLLLEAEAASLVAHQRGLECVPYSTAINASTKENLSLLGELHKAMQRGELSMYYQPKVGVQTGKTCGAEALIRWQHPIKGMIAPAMFIPRAEQSTLIHAVTEFAMTQAMEQSRTWQRSGLKMPVAINVSPRSLANSNFADNVFRLLDRYGLEGDAIEMEITEGAFMVDIERSLGELNRLADRKIAISVDDFGTGYSSLQYLHRLPVSYIKIDQSFVQRASTDDGALHIIESAVSLAHKLGIRTVAEGVECKATHLLLTELGCDIEQGYAICRPVPAAELVNWYAQHRHGFFLY